MDKFVKGFLSLLVNGASFTRYQELAPIKVVHAVTFLFIYID